MTYLLNHAEDLAPKRLGLRVVGGDQVHGLDTKGHPRTRACEWTPDAQVVSDRLRTHREEKVGVAELLLFKQRVKRLGRC